MALSDRKKHRVLNYSLTQLFSRKAFSVPHSIDDFRVADLLVRELRLSAGRTILLTDEGMHRLQILIDGLDDADLFSGLAGYSDIARAVRGLVQSFLSTNRRPADINEFIEHLRDQVTPSICDRTYVVPLLGITLDEKVQALQIGTFQIVRPSIDALSAAGAALDDSDVARISHLLKAPLWIVGSEAGTAEVAEEAFRYQTDLFTGMLAIFAATLLRDGANRIRIVAGMAPGHISGQASWVSWTKGVEGVERTTCFGSAQPLPISAELAQILMDESELASMFVRIFKNKSRSPLEESIMKGVYWYSDAHRDPNAVMKLVKFWSCFETFFSMSKNGIVESVSSGIAAVLIYGGYKVAPIEDFEKLKKRAKALYDLRSRAVHRGAHVHVVPQDNADLSRWAAWLLINMVALTDRGYRTLDQLKTETERLCGMHQPTGGDTTGPVQRNNEPAA